MNQTPSSNWLTTHRPFSYTLQGTPEDVSQALVTLNEEGGCLNGYRQSVQINGGRGSYFFTLTIQRRNRIFYTTAEAEGRITAQDSGKVTVEGYAGISGSSLAVIVTLMAVLAIFISISSRVPIGTTAIMATFVTSVWIGLLYYDRSTAFTGIETAMMRVQDYGQMRKDREVAKQNAAAYWKGVEAQRAAQTQRSQEKTDD